MGIPYLLVREIIKNYSKGGLRFEREDLQIGLYIVSAMSILTGFVTLPSGGIVAVVSGIGGIILTVLLSKRTKELNKTINDKDYEIQCLNNSVVNNTTELVATQKAPGRSSDLPPTMRQKPLRITCKS